MVVLRGAVNLAQCGTENKEGKRRLCVIISPHATYLPEKGKQASANVIEILARSFQHDLYIDPRTVVNRGYEKKSRG